MKTIHISEINSAGISGAAKAAGCEYIELIGAYEHPDHPGSNDWSIRVYEVDGVRVIDTNADPVWEERDYQVFSALLTEYGVEA